MLNEKIPGAEPDFIVLSAHIACQLIRRLICDPRTGAFITNRHEE